MKDNPVAVDTNVLIYLHDSTGTIKRNIAVNLLSDNPKIPSQVVSEYLNTIRRLLPASKEDLLIHTANLFTDCIIIPTLPSTLQRAASLVKKYQFQLFDAVIVAAAIEGGCTTLYSEDMQHGLVIDKTFTILNPFL